MGNSPDNTVAKKRRRLLLIIFLLLTVSLCYLSYIVGRTGVGISYSGRIVDSIILSPGNGSSQRYLIDIVGYVRYSDGTPYPNGTVELRSEIMYSVTDETGRFEFKDVPEGEHTISVVKNGIVLASCTITVERASYVSNVEIIKFGDKSYRITVPLNIITIELHIIIDLESGTLYFDEETITAPQIVVSDGNSPSLIWTQSTSVDIFAERSGNNGVTTIDGVNVIAPGSNGKYIFRIQNPEKYPVVYTVTLLETDENNPPLPMKYRLMEGISGNGYIGGNNWKVAGDISSQAVTLAAGQDTYYTLEWKWDSTSDVTDTALGMQTGNPVYILEIVVNAQY